MKRILSLLLAIVIVFVLSACKKENNSSTDTNTLDTTQTETVGTDAINTQNNTPNKNSSATKTPSNSTSTPIKNNNPATNSTPSSSTTTPSVSQPTTQVHTHTYSNYKCTGCGQMDKGSMFDYFKDWVINNGTVKGDYVYYSKPADNYGGYSEEDFSLYYWADTEKIEFCLHSVLDEEYSINFYIYIPKNHTGNYEYITSYYYRETGESVCESKGIIEGKSFTKNHPLNSNKYIGSASMQNNFMEMSRQGICDTLDCLKQFLQKETTGYTFSDLGFEKY